VKYNTYDLFIFDFDGTLGDTQDCVVASFQQTITDNKLQKPKKEDIVNLMGLSLEQVFRQLIGDTYEKPFYEKLIDDYRCHYRNYLASKTKIFKGVRETLAYIKNANCVCSIATSKKTEFATLSCRFLNIDKYIDYYIGDDKVTNKKPHPEMLEKTYKDLRIDSARSVLIGDSTFDIDMGNAMGIDTIAVTWGAHSEAVLRASMPTYIISSFSELRKFVKK